MGRGGYRPGAGFQKGNLQALKHGRYSPRLQELIETFPEGFLILDKKKGIIVVHKKEKEGG